MELKLLILLYGLSPACGLNSISYFDLGFTKTPSQSFFTFQILLQFWRHARLGFEWLSRFRSFCLQTNFGASLGSSACLKKHSSPFRKQGFPRENVCFPAKYSISLKGNKYSLNCWLHGFMAFCWQPWGQTGSRKSGGNWDLCKYRDNSI